MTKSQTGNNRDDDLIQQFCIKYVNKKVKEYFKDISDNNAKEDTPRGIARKLCLHKDNDPLNLTIARLLVYNFVLDGFEVNNDDIYGIPITTFHESNIFLPQVVLHFKETMKDMKARGAKRQLTARVGFRVKDSNLSKTDAQNLAKKIKQEFAPGSKYSFKKGEVKISYRDKAKGYEFILTVFNEAEAKEVIKKVMVLQGDTPDWSNLTNSESARDFKVTGKNTILGEQYDKPKFRQIGTVYFTKAELKIHGMSPDKILVDTTGRGLNSYA